MDMPSSRVSQSNLAAAPGFERATPAGGSNDFYAHLSAVDDFIDVSRPENYSPLPEDWLVVVSDVEGSTTAVRQGRYKDVNILGASSIISILNAARPIAIPYVFGGDGASLCIPPSLLEKTRQALRTTQRMAREEFHLNLRAGIVPVQAIHAAGYAINIAKCRVSKHYMQVAFTGGGSQYAERLIKDPEAGKPFRLGETDDVAGEKSRGDFSGLECRWDSIPSPHGEIVTLMVQAIRSDPAKNAQTYRDVLVAISEIYGHNEVSRPVSPASMKLTFDDDKLRGEALVRMAGKPRWIQQAYILFMKFQLVFGKMFIDKGWHVAGIDWRKYKQDVIANTDYRKFDDVLRHVLSGSRKQRETLEALLERRYQRGELVYGTHSAPSALMTCLIFH